MLNSISGSMIDCIDVEVRAVRCEWMRMFHSNIVFCHWHTWFHRALFFQIQNTTHLNQIKRIVTTNTKTRQPVPIQISRLFQDTKEGGVGESSLSSVSGVTEALVNGVTWINPGEHPIRNATAVKG